MRTTKRYLDNWQSIVSGNILSYDKRNSSLSKLGISFLFDKLNSATAAFKALEALARILLPEIQAFFESEEGQREYAEWKAKQQAEQENKA